MISFSVKRYLPYSSSQIFNLVIDVESYPEFLPWCISAKEYGINKERFKANLEIGFNLISESYSSEITAIYPKTIVSKSISGPFKTLKNEWLFRDVSERECEIQLNIDFKLKSLILHNLIGKVFEYSSRKMIYAFEKRARDLYG